MALSDTAIRNISRENRARLAAGESLDGGGLYLLAKPDGARWWRWDYRRPVTGKRNTFSLGV